MAEPVVIVEYNPDWPRIFQSLSAPIVAALGELVAGVEHIGSTAVPGLAAKPIIDLDVLAPSRAEVPAVIERLATLGYLHSGDQGIRGREAFAPPPQLPLHHLYVCAQGNREYQRHIAFRDHLRSHPQDAWAYAALKRSAACRFRDDRVAYTEAKTEFIAEILRRAQGKR